MSDQDLIIKLTQLEERKKALKAEITQMEDAVQTSFEYAREDLSGMTSPAWWVRKYPLQAVGMAVVFGFLAARGGRGRGSLSFAGALISELKAVAARKAVQAFVETIDKKG